MKHTIVIVDDHILIAKALAGIISDFKDFEVLYECGNGKELQDKFSQKKNIPSIVLLDVSMPIMDGFATSKWLQDEHPNVLILALSMQDDETSLLKMIKNGARGYLLKNSAPNELETALRTIINNGYYYPDWASKIVFSNITNTTKTTSNTVALDLTDREKEFLKLCTTDLSYKEISEKMNCSPRTVEDYKNRLCEKLNIKSRVGLAIYAVKCGLA
jgi:DNA-binding NarL/FixJ family response regulator